MTKRKIDICECVGLHSLYIVIFIVLVSCAPTEKQLKERATELCRYIPDHELLTQSRDYLTEDFYVVLDTMFNHLPEDEELDHRYEQRRHHRRLRGAKRGKVRRNACCCHCPCQAEMGRWFI